MEWIEDSWAKLNNAPPTNATEQHMHVHNALAGAYTIVLTWNRKLNENHKNLKRI